MATQPFQWFGNQAITSPEQAQRKRAIAEALIGQSATPANNWSEGLADVAAALSGTILEGRVSDAEEAGRERAGGLFANLALNQDPNSIIAALTSPDAVWGSPTQTSIATALLDNSMRQNDPMYQLQMQTAQAELDALRNPAPDNPYLNVGGGSIFNTGTGEFMTAPVTGNGLSITTPDGTVVQQGGPAVKLTEGQGKDIVYFTRGLDANSMLNGVEQNLTDWGQENAGKLPLGVGNYFREPAFRQAKIAADAFLAAVLRKDTGAAITDQEFEIYGPIFLPIPGDDPATIQTKRRMRDVALVAIKGGLGTADAVANANAAVLGLDPNAPVRPAGDPTTPVQGGARIISVE